MLYCLNFKKCSKVVLQRLFKVCFFFSKRIRSDPLIEWWHSGIFQVTPTKSDFHFFSSFQFWIVRASSSLIDATVNGSGSGLNTPYREEPSVLPCCQVQILFTVQQNQSHRTPASRCCWPTWQFPCQKNIQIQKSSFSCTFRHQQFNKAAEKSL